jgi:hypothetical protein
MKMETLSHSETTSTLETDPQVLVHGICNKDDEVAIIELPHSFWHLVADAFKTMDSPMPNPSTSAIVAAVENGKILSFVVLQTKLHAEPGFTYPEAQHRRLLEQIYKKIDQVVHRGMDYIITTESDAIARRAEAIGFIPMGKALGKVAGQ